MDELLSDSLNAAKKLLGYKLVHETPLGRLSGYIVETEAYSSDDPASHTFRGQTARNAPMFGPAGTVYVYFTYGMHFCMNIATGAAGHGQGVLIRALEPDEGIEIMFRNRGLIHDAEHSYLDAAQGSQEERAKRTDGTMNERQTPADAVMRSRALAGVSGSALREPEGSSEPRTAGQQGKAVRMLCNGPGKLTQALGITRTHSGGHILSGPIKLEPGFNPKKIVQTTRIGIRQATDKPWRFYVKDNPFVSKKITS